MGTTLGKPFAGLFYEIEPRIVFFGLPATGKSSILHKLKTGESLSTNMPTVGLGIECFKYKNSSFCFYEMGGQDRYRMIPLWKHYLGQVSGFVYVVDSTDRRWIEEAKSYLHMVMDEQEVPGAMSASESSNKLDLVSLRQRNWQRNWHVQSSCALSGDGLHEGLDWLLKNAERM